MPKLSDFDDRPVETILNEKKEEYEKSIMFNIPTQDEIQELYKKIDKKYTKIADNEIYNLVNVFANFYVQMDNKEKVEGEKKNMYKSAREFAIDMLNTRLKSFIRKDGDGPRAKILENLFRKNVIKYKESLEMIYGLYMSNVIGEHRDKKITSIDIRWYLQNYTP